MHYQHQHTQIYVYAMRVLDSRMYIVINDQKPNEALIIDPIMSEDALPVLQTIQSATVLLTHSHYDHISGVNWLREKTTISVYCSENCASRLPDPHTNMAAYSAALIMGKTEEEQEECMSFIDFKFSCTADRTFKEETSFSFGSYLVNITHTPGHSTCSQCITLTTQKKELTPVIVFTGDSLVNGYKVITRLPDGSKKDYERITKPFLDSISDSTLIMPGHGDWGTKKELCV